MDNEALDILKALQSDMKTFQSDMKAMRTDIKSMQSDMKSMQSDIKSIQSDINTLNVKVDKLESQVDENTKILKSLEHASEVNAAERDKTNLAIARIEGNIEALRKDVTNVEIITSSNWNDIAKLKAVK